MKIGFDNDKYLKMQSEHIRERIGKFGGKLFDDYHASRVLPGFEPDSKLRLLKELSDQAEIVFAISAKDIEKNKIEIELLCPEEPVMAEINIEQMNKVMLSLLKNSVYALLKKLQKQEFSPLITIQVEKRLNGTVFLSIRDNGIGIEDSIKARIFEPFFTTKPTAEAAGVGLYLCREVILNHQGSIIVKSEKDNFTEFMITIPIYQKSNDNG